MTKDKILEVCDTYNDLLVDIKPVREPNISGSKRHIKWMLEEINLFLVEDRLDKAFRWLGFIQGAFWVDGTFSIEDMKTHNRKVEENN